MELILSNVTPTGDLVIADCRSAISFGGKSRTDKQLSVISAGLSRSVTMLAATRAGKVGKLARENMGIDASALISHDAARGNFTPLYEALVLTSVKCLQPITNASAYDMARGFVKGMRDNLRNGGYSAAGKLTAEARAYDECIALFADCDRAIAARKEADAKRRAEQQAKLETNVEATVEG